MYDAPAGPADMAADEGPTVRDMKRDFLAYSTAKRGEIEEARLSWRYYHGAQWTDDQLKVLNKRKQPVITFNRTSRKINGLVGILQRMRADPKAFPRTPDQQQVADLATHALRHALDEARWEDIDPKCVLDGGVHGFGVVELTLEPSRHGDTDVGLEYVDPRTFFYDPRSVRMDFSDALYMGVAKWADRDELIDSFGLSQEVADQLGPNDQETTTEHDADLERLWFDMDKNRVRVVDHWYVKRGQWRWCLFAGGVKLAQGESPFRDHQGKSVCKYRAFSGGVDHDGDRYSFVRNLKGPQDAMNQHRSKAMHIMNTRQIVAGEGAIADIEKARTEAQRPDGVLIVEDFERFRIDQPDQEFIQQTNYFQDAKAEIENFGPNPAIVGTGVEARSGRALAMMQQSGIAELGPFMASYRAWKLDIYRALWEAIRIYWTAERWIRVSGPDGMQAFAVNGLQLDEFGVPRVVNPLAQMDADIVVDEGPDVASAMGDTFDALMSLAQNKVPIPPQVLIEMASLPQATKERVLGMLNQPNPAQQQAAQLDMADKAARTAKTQAETQRIQVETAGGIADRLSPMQPMPMQPATMEAQPAF